MRIITTRDFIEGRIPKIEDFKLALEQFEQDCIIPFLGQEVVGSFAYGSVNRDDCNVASDVDYFIVISDGKHKKTIRDATEKAYKEKNVYIQTRVINQEHAEAGFHGLDKSFREHLELTVAQYSHKGKNPLEILAENNVPLKQSLKKSMAIYLMKLNNGYTSFPTSEEAYVDFLQDIMGKPFHAMRVAVQYALGTVAPEGKEAFHDTKEEIIRIYSGLDFVTDDLMADVTKLRKIARNYIKLLESRQKEEIPEDQLEKRYSQMLNKIMDCYPIACHFIEQNAKYMIN